MANDYGQLIIQIEGKVIQTVALTAEPLRIGRLPSNGLVLPNPIVSGQHAEIKVTPDGVFLTDVGSRNGTFVQGRQLLANQPEELADGVSFQIGPFTLTYRAAAAAAEPEEVKEPEVIPVEAPPPPPPAEPPPYTPPPSPRPTYPMPLARGPVSRYLRDLPIVYHDNEFLGRYLLIFESIWEPLEQRQDHIAMYLDPRTCPAQFLPWLASWVGLSLSSAWPEAYSRRLVSEAMDVYRWRGTRYGLTRVIELCTGLAPEVTEDPANPLVFRVRVQIPPESGIEPEMIESLVRTHKPAHVGYVIEFT